MVQKASVSAAAGATASASAKPAVDEAAVDKAFEALKTYDYGANRAALMPLDEAIVACLGDPDARKQLEARLAGVLKADVPRLAREYVCRKLRLVGTADSAPALAERLADEGLSHLACAALECIPGPEAVQALRESLPKLSGRQKVGVIAALGARRDPQAAPLLATLPADPDREIAGAAAAALGRIGTPEAGEALRKSLSDAVEAVRSALADGCLACAERLAAGGRAIEARALYEALAASPQPEHVHAAARRGLSAAPSSR